MSFGAPKPDHRVGGSARERQVGKTLDACEMFKGCEYLSALIGSILKDEVLHLEPTLCLGYKTVRHP